MTPSLNPGRAETIEDMRARRANLMMQRQWEDVAAAWETLVETLLTAGDHPKLDNKYFNDELIKYAQAILLLSPSLDSRAYVHIVHEEPEE